MTTTRSRQLLIPPAFGLVVLLLGSTQPAAADIRETSTVVHATRTAVDLDLSDQTVLCSAADYGSTFLKVLIPELAGLTLLDHQNSGAGAPCVAAGECITGEEPAALIDASRPVERVDVTVEARRYDVVDTEAQVCSVTLVETVGVRIRGVDFTHERFAALGDRAYSDCIAAELPSVDEGVDAPPPPFLRADDDASDLPGSGGCSTTTRPGGGGLIMLFALAGWLRRRRG